MILLFTKLLLAHVLGDFYLQPTNWVEDKEANTYKSKYLYLHALLHGILVMVLLWDIQAYKLALSIAVIHWMIDLWKLLMQTAQNKRNWFFIDQLLHVISIYLCASIYMYDAIIIDFESLLNNKNLLILTAYLTITWPTSIFIQKMLLPWTNNLNEDDDMSLLNAGKYIGILERSFVFIFVFAGRWESIGFLIAAKSVFRFGDLKESRDRKLTEYILLGTLVSFGLAMVVTMLTLHYFNTIN
ncbi:MAG: DUF3307 domain-containing protein [Saprospiraceae bacterium]